MQGHHPSGSRTGEEGARVIVADAPLSLLAIQIQPLERKDAFESRFTNWVMWCARKGLHQARAGSAEGAWRSPQIWHPPEPRPPVINDPDAVVVNRAYTQLAILAPSYARALQVLVFMPWLKPQRQAQILGTHYLRLDALLEKSKQMLKNQLNCL
jgi:hypothetical protein